jgi:hypothetical protein
VSNHVAAGLVFLGAALIASAWWMQDPPTATGASGIAMTPTHAPLDMSDWEQLDRTLKGMRSNHVALDPRHCMGLKTDEAHFICLQQVVDMAKMAGRFSVVETACTSFREDGWTQTCRMDLIDAVQPEDPAVNVATCRDWAPMYLADCLIHASERWVGRAQAGNPHTGMGPAQVVATMGHLAGLVAAPYSPTLADSLADLLHTLGGAPAQCLDLHGMVGSEATEATLGAMATRCEERLHDLASGRAHVRAGGAWK